MNALRLGDEVWVNTYHPLPPTLRWHGRVKAFRTQPDRVLVESTYASDDPCVINEMWTRYGALSR